MLKFFVVLCALGVLAPAQATAQIDAHRQHATADSIALASFAHSLTDGAVSDSARAAALYEWIARNVAYDVPGYLAGRLDDGSAEQVYQRRIAVCGGFVTLFQRMAADVGLEVMPILGYAKGFDYRRGASSRKPNHSWAAVKIDRVWRLIDPTWAAGVVNEGRFEPHFTWDYFLIDPAELILSHFPRREDWQLLAQRMSRSDFEHMPLVPRVVVDAGFTPDAIRRAATQSDVRDFPLIGVRDKNRARVISAPIAGTLKRGSRVAVDIYWPEAGDVALVSGGSWTHLQRVGDHFRGEAPARENTLQVVGRPLARRVFETLLQYAVQ